MRRYCQNSKTARSRSGILFALLLCIGWTLSGRAERPVTTLSALEASARLLEPRNMDLKIEGTVRWSSATEGRIILQDASAVCLLELQFPCPMPALNRQIWMEGRCAVVRSRDALILSSVPVVENNGLHPLIEKSGRMMLEAGMHPVEVVWFNRTDRSGLEVEYEGPGVERRPVPDSELFRQQNVPDAGKTNRVNGLDYRCVEGQWWRLLPNFDHRPAVRSGTVPNFDIGVKSRAKHVGIQFKGQLRIAQRGTYSFHLRSDDGSRLFIGAPTIRIEELGSGRPAQTTASDAEFQWLEIEGDLLSVNRTGAVAELELMTPHGVVHVKVAEPPPATVSLKPYRHLRLSGVSRRVRSLSGSPVPAEFYVQSLETALSPAGPSAGPEGTLPLLTSVGQIYQLSLDESSRKYPVRVRGVITSPMENNGAVLQDAGRGIYVALNGPVNLRMGDYCEVEGTTGPYTFSPFIDATNVQVLGAGVLPEPVKPSWDQLINGSLHGNFVELEGVVTDYRNNTVALLTRDGLINVRLNPLGPPMPPGGSGATIRIRGCLLADWDGRTSRVVVGSIYIDQQWITIAEPAPADPFAVPYKHIDDLLQFDPRAGALQRIRVLGSLIYKGDKICCLMDGTSGLRFIPAGRMEAEIGDRIEVSGFLDLEGPSPILHEAVIRKTDRAGLPEPVRLEQDALLRDTLDATYVQVEAVLLSAAQRAGKTVLELQCGLRRFTAELNGAPADELLSGSRLELTGTYFGEGGNRVLRRPIDSFRLLLNSADAITVLSRPPWWTPARMLSVVGLLAAVLAAAAVWIRLLRRTVEERTRELGRQIRERQHAEQQRRIELERARVAHDLHDDLGARLTEVNMLASLVNNPHNTPDDRARYSDQLKSIALHMVTALDEIVWAVNPRNDTVSSLVGYFGAHAQRLLELASISCGLDVDDCLPELALPPRARREIFLAFKEALANIVRHASARKVWLHIFVQDRDLVVELTDGGSGFDPGERKAGSDGLINMEERMKNLGGECTIKSEPGKGTTVRLQVPLEGES